MSEPISLDTPQDSTMVVQGVAYVPTPDEFPYPPDTTHLTTEDDTPVDNFSSEKHQRLLTEPLYSSWPGPDAARPFLVAANVGLFWIPRDPAIVPDVMLSLDVAAPQDWWGTRSYFLWEFGKPPEVVIEIVSNTKGQEQGKKRTTYAQIDIPYYIIYDPQQYLHGDVLTVYELRGGQYVQRPDTWLPTVGLGVCLWDGTFEEREDTWLRWCDQTGVVIPTGAERAEQEHQRAEQEHQRAGQERQRAEQERQRAEQEYQRAERLAEQLRRLGIEPDRV